MTKGFDPDESAVAHRILGTFEEYEGITPQTLLIPARKAKDVANRDCMARDADFREWLLCDADILAPRKDTIYTPEVIVDDVPAVIEPEPTPVAPVAPATDSPFQSFLFGLKEIRTIMQDDEPWFVAKDVAEALGYVNTEKAIRTHCKCSKLLKQSELGGLKNVSPRGMKIIPERDIYRLGMKCQLEIGEQFEEWVVGEVIPSIRKRGMYATPMTTKQMISNPRFAIELLEELEREQEQKAELQHKNLVLAERCDEAIRTKAQIGDKKVATAMSTASALKRENKKLKDELGRGETWKRVSAILS